LQCNLVRAVNEGDGLGGGNNNQLPDCDGISPALKRFKHLSARVTTEVNTSLPGTETPQTQLSKYISELEDGFSVLQNDPLSFWLQRSFHVIADLARDLLAAPALQAFVIL